MRFYKILILASGLFISSPLYAEQITIHWTAPGDDGDSGTCFLYEIRAMEIGDTLLFDWESAFIIENNIIPQEAGSLETLTIVGLNNSWYCFAIKAVDEALNWSEQSNLCLKNPYEVGPPTLIRWEE